MWGFQRFTILHTTLRQTAKTIRIFFLVEDSCVGEGGGGGGSYREISLAQGEETLPNYMTSKQKLSLTVILRKSKLFGNFHIIIYV